MNGLILALAAAAAAAQAPPPAEPPPAQPEARIPFVAFGAIRHFEPAGKNAVYLQDRRRNWYRAELMGRCLELPYARRIGVDTGGGPFVDRFSALIVEGQRCPLRSLTRSEPPPPRPAKKKRH